MTRVYNNDTSMFNMGPTILFQAVLYLLKCIEYILVYMAWPCCFKWYIVYMLTRGCRVKGLIDVWWFYVQCRMEEKKEPRLTYRDRKAREQQANARDNRKKWENREEESGEKEK